MFKFSIFPKLNSDVVRQHFLVDIPIENVTEFILEKVCPYFPVAKLIETDQGLLMIDRSLVAIITKVNI